MLIVFLADGLLFWIKNVCLRAIETLKAVDLVWQTGATELKPIAQTFEKYAATLALTFDNGETIETTREHPFYVQNRGFVKAGELGIGSSIVTRAGPTVQLVATTAGAAQTVYNFEVADYHTYFVGQGEVWVHNTCKDRAWFENLQKTGGLYEIDLGDVQGIAEVEVIGDTLHLKSVTIYLKDEASRTLSDAEMQRRVFRFLSNAKGDARGAGFSNLRASGERVPGSSSVNPGHTFDIAVSL